VINHLSKIAVAVGCALRFVRQAQSKKVPPISTMSNVSKNSKNFKESALPSNLSAVYASKPALAISVL
jgi:hypothetical protein